MDTTWEKMEYGMKRKGAFDPGRYGLEVCSFCNGTGLRLEFPGIKKAVCLQCGGFGLLRKNAEDTGTKKGFLE